MEDAVDQYEDHLGTYLVKFTGRELSTAQNEEVSKFLHTIGDFERISDHAMNLAEVAREIYEKDIRFTDAAQRGLDVLRTAVSEIVSLVVGAFIGNDLEMALRVEAAGGYDRRIVRRDEAPPHHPSAGTDGERASRRRPDLVQLKLRQLLEFRHGSAKHVQLRMAGLSPSPRIGELSRDHVRRCVRETDSFYAMARQQTTVSWSGVLDSFWKSDTAD